MTTAPADVEAVGEGVTGLGEDPGLPVEVSAVTDTEVDPPYTAGPPGVVMIGSEVVDGGAVYTVITSTNLVAKTAETPDTKVVPLTSLKIVQSPEVLKSLAVTHFATVSQSFRQASTLVNVCLPATWPVYWFEPKFEPELTLYWLPQLSEQAAALPKAAEVAALHAILLLIEIVDGEVTP